MQAHLILKDVSIAITLVSKKLSVLSERINFEIKFFLNFLGTLMSGQIKKSFVSLAKSSKPAYSKSKKDKS